MRLPSGWSKTVDRKGELDQIKDDMAHGSGASLNVVLSYERKNDDGVTVDKIDVVMEEDIDGGFEYYWRYDDYSGGQLEYEYDVFGSTLSSFDKARSSALKKVEVVDDNRQ